MNIKRVYSIDEANAIVTKDGIWDDCSCDLNGDRDDFSFADHINTDDVEVFVCYEGSIAAGFWLFIPREDCWDMHIAFLTGYRGDYTIEATKLAIDLLPCRMPVVVEIPEYNKKAIRHAHRFGFEDVGSVLADWTKNGVKPMVRHMILTLGGATCHQQ